MFKAPKFELKPKRQAEIPFSGTVLAGLWLTLLSSRITYPFRILRASMIFPEQANNLVFHYWLISQNVQVSTTALPSGENIFGRESPTANFIGKGIIKNVNCNVEVPEANVYIKLVTNNTLGVTYTINGTMIIQEL